jgi:hypothetical protein
MCTRMIPALVPRGARQRGRTADGRARARHVRVLTPRVLNQGVLNKGAQKGYSQLRRKCFGCLRPYSSDNGWAVLGSVVRTRSMAVRIGYARGTHGVLLGYPHSGELSPAAAVRSDARARAATRRVLTGYSEGADRVLKGTHGVLPRVLIGCSRVLTGYSHGTGHAATHAAPLSGGRGSLCRTQWAVRGTRA